jgi:hypothetical protein
MLKRTILSLIIWGVVFCGLGYTAVENISNSSYDSTDACVAINSAGQIGVIWIEKFPGGAQHVYYSIRGGSGSWSTPAMIPGISGNNAYPRIARGTNGGFVAAWHDLAFQCMRFSQYNGSWSTPVTVSNIGGYDMGSPSITSTTNGRVAVAWTVGNPTFPDAYVNIYNGVWSGPRNISNTTYGSKYCDLTAGPNGEIYAVWQDNLYLASTGVDYFYTMMSSDHGNGSWSSPQIIDNLNAWTFRPVVAVNSQYDILSCFYYMHGSSYWSVYYQNGSWGTPHIISDTGDHHDHNAYFSAVCPYGNDGFLFIYRDCGYNIAYTIARDGAVGNAVYLTNSYQCYHPYIAFSSSIGAVAVWTDWSRGGDVFAYIFDPDDSGNPDDPPIPPPAISTPQPPLGVEANYLNIPLAPLDLRTELVINRNLFTVQYYRKLTWAFNGNWSNWGITLTKYRIFRMLKTAADWEFLAEVSPSVLQYIDKNGISEEDRFDYAVRGVDSLGNEFYAYNWVRWAPNPANAEKLINIIGYNVYRKLAGQSTGSFSVWKAVDAATNSIEDHSTEIRQQTLYDYAVSAISDKGIESEMAEAVKFTSSKRQVQKH